MPTRYVQDEIDSGWDGTGGLGDGGPSYIPPKWLDIAWTFTEGQPAGQLTGFEVGVVAGTTPETDPWLVPPMTVGPAERRVVRSVTTLDPLTNARACVRGIFGARVGPWTVQGSGQTVGRSLNPVALQTAMDAITSDAVLSKAEKPGVITEFNAAANDYAILTGRASSAGVDTAEFASAWSTLNSYMTSLSPAYTDTAADTAIDPTTWQTTWGNYYKAYTALLTKIAGAPPAAVAGVSDTNQNLTTNAAAPTVDGVTRAAGDLIILRGQSTPAQNGLYQIGYTAPAGAAVNAYPTGGTASGTGSYSSDSLAYDNSGAPNYTPNDSTAADLSGPPTLGNHEVTYSGWSGSWTAGQLRVKLDPYCDIGAEAEASVHVLYSTDGGTTWIAAATYTSLANGTTQDCTVDLTGVTASLLRVRVMAYGYRARVWDADSGSYYWDQGGSTAAIKSVYFYVPAAGSANYYFTKVADVMSGSTWAVSTGTNYGGRTWNATVSGTTITLAQTVTYSQPWDINFNQVAKPAAAQKLLVMVAPRGFRVLATGHQGKTYVNPTATATLTLKKNGSSIGTLQFNTSGVFSVVSVNQTDFLPGDILTVEAPGSQDATFADFGVTIKAQTL